MPESLIQGYRFFRVQIEVTKENTRPILQMCYQKPIPNPPYVEFGIVDIVLANHPELQSLVEQATGLAVPIALGQLLNPPDTLEPEEVV